MNQKNVIKAKFFELIDRLAQFDFDAAEEWAGN
jgi:hypothetical protein